MKNDFSIDSNLRAFESKAIRIRVPASVAFDLKKSAQVTAIVLGELGCPACHSGFDLRFDFEREFTFNTKLDRIQNVSSLGR